MKDRRAHERPFTSIADALLRHSADAVLLTKLDGTILRANPAACAVLGRSEQELRGLGRAGILVPDENTGRLLAERDRATTVRGEVVFRRADGTTFPADLTSTIIPRPVEPIALAIFRDLSEQRRAERELRESEHRARARLAELEALYATAPVGLCVFDTQLRWVRLNRQIAEINGVPLEAHLGRTPREVVPDVGEQAEAALRTILETGEPLLDFEMTGTTRAQPGVQRCWNERWAPIRDDQGRIVGISVAAEEITARKRAEAALRESEERFHTLADHIAQLAWMADGQGALVWFNARWFDYTATTLREVEGRGWRKVLHPDHADRVLARASRAVRTGEPWEDTFPLRGRDGAYRWFLCRATPIRDERGAVSRWFGTNTDVTEQREAQQALRQANERKTTFLAVLSHELRNPLGAIRNGLAVLDRAPGCEHTGRVRGIIRRQLDHVTRLVDDLLDISRISHGKLALQRSRLDAREVVRGACDGARSAFEERSVALRLDLSPDPLWVDADQTRFTQIVANLLGNALKFTPPQGEVEVLLRARDGEAELRVRDTGSGIEPHLLDAIFDPFTQADPGGTPRAGMGLGLALVKTFVTMHEGWVRAHSEGSGKGAEFVVALPLARAPAWDEAAGARWAPALQQPEPPAARH